MIEDFEYLKTLIEMSPDLIDEIVIPRLSYFTGLIEGVVKVLATEAGLTPNEISSAIMTAWDSEGIFELDDLIEFALQLNEGEQLYKLKTSSWPEGWSTHRDENLVSLDSFQIELIK